MIPFFNVLSVLVAIVWTWSVVGEMKNPFINQRFRWRPSFAVSGPLAFVWLISRLFV